MRFTPLAATAAPDFAPTAGLPDSGRVLGRVQLRVLDREEGITFGVRNELLAGGRVGAFDGYATLRDALSDLAHATTGDATAAAVILERGGRFFGHALKGRTLVNGARSEVRPIFLEEDTGQRVLELRAFDRHRRLRAIVDGAFSHRFRA